MGILLGAVGVVMILGEMTGAYGAPVTLTLWTIVGIAWVVAALRLGERAWLVVFVAGVASGLFAGAMQALFLDVLVARNDAWNSFTVDGGTRFEAFYTALPIGFVWGLLFAGVAAAARYLRTHRRPAVST